MKGLRSEVFIYHDKFQDLSDKAIDFFIKSIKYLPESEEWQICRLKERIYNREAIKYLIKLQEAISE
jgi:hypothetical protein